MTGQTTKPHPTPGVWRTRVWQSDERRGWGYRMYLTDGGRLGGWGFRTEAEARRALALRYRQHFSTDAPTLLARADHDWQETARHYRPKEQQA